VVPRLPLLERDAQPQTQISPRMPMSPRGRISPQLTSARGEVSGPTSHDATRITPSFGTPRDSARLDSARRRQQESEVKHVQRRRATSASSGAGNSARRPNPLLSGNRHSRTPLSSGRRSQRAASPEDAGDAGSASGSARGARDSLVSMNSTPARGTGARSTHRRTSSPSEMLAQMAQITQHSICDEASALPCSFEEQESAIMTRRRSSAVVAEVSRPCRSSAEPLTARTESGFGSSPAGSPRASSLGSPSRISAVMATPVAATPSPVRHCGGTGRMGATFSDGNSGGQQRTPRVRPTRENCTLHTALTAVDSPTSVENVRSQQQYEQRQRQARQSVQEVDSMPEQQRQRRQRPQNDDLYRMAFDLDEDADACEDSAFRMIEALCDKAQKVVFEMSALIPPMPPAGGNLRAQAAGKPPRPPSPAAHTPPGKTLRITSAEHQAMDATQSDDGQEELTARVQGAAISDATGSQALGVAGVTATPRAAFEEQMNQAARFLGEGSNQVAGVLLQSKELMRALEVENNELRSENGELRRENRYLRAHVGAEVTAGNGSTRLSVAESARGYISSPGQHQERMLSQISHTPPVVQSKALTAAPLRRASVGAIASQALEAGVGPADTAVAALISSCTALCVHPPPSVTSTPIQTSRPLSATASSSSITSRQRIVTTTLGKENALPVRQASYAAAPCVASTPPPPAFLSGTASYRSPVVIEAQVPTVRASAHVVQAARAVG